MTNDLSRRGFVIGAAVAAGIGAARTVASYGRTVLLLEAQDGAGGRARCDNTTFAEVPFDLGARFFGVLRHIAGPFVRDGFFGCTLAAGGNITLLQGAYNSGIAAATGALHAIGAAVSAPTIANIDW